MQLSNFKNLQDRRIWKSIEFHPKLNEAKPTKNSPKVFSSLKTNSTPCWKGALRIRVSRACPSRVRNSHAFWWQRSTRMHMSLFVFVENDLKSWVQIQATLRKYLCWNGSPSAGLCPKNISCINQKEIIQSSISLSVNIKEGRKIFTINSKNSRADFLLWKRPISNPFPSALFF